MLCGVNQRWLGRSREINQLSLSSECGNTQDHGKCTRLTVKIWTLLHLDNIYGFKKLAAHNARVSLDSGKWVLCFTPNATLSSQYLLNTSECCKVFHLCTICNEPVHPQDSYIVGRLNSANQYSIYLKKKAHRLTHNHMFCLY